MLYRSKYALFDTYDTRFADDFVAIRFTTILVFERNIAEQTRFAYAAVPGLEDCAEIRGYSIQKTATIWYFLMRLAKAFIS